MADQPELRAEIAEAIGVETILEEKRWDRDFPIEFTVQPRTSEQLRQLAGLCLASGVALYPIGGGTRFDWGTPPTKPGIAAATTALNQVVDYPSEDMTITVQTGISCARLNETLADRRQQLPIDIPLADQATLGGAIACNLSGPRRFGHGTFRDYVIGIQVLDGFANLTRAGGRVVKNVAGYDLCKLYTGSYGTLGIITEVTLKVRPLPETRLVACVGLPDQQSVEDFDNRIRSDDLGAVAIDFYNETAVNHLCSETSTQLPGGHCLAWVVFEGSSKTTAWQRAQFDDLSPVPVKWLEGAQADASLRCASDFQRAELGQVSFKANLLASGGVSFFQLAHDMPVAVQLHAGSGIAHGHLAGDFDSIVGPITRLRDHALTAKGNLVVRSCPHPWKARLEIWGAARSDWGLMKSLKSSMDPNELLNPGRFVAGI